MTTSLMDCFFHLDVLLAALTVQYGAWIYLILFLVISVETGWSLCHFCRGIRLSRKPWRRPAHLAVVFLSLLPGVIDWMNERRKQKHA